MIIRNNIPALIAHRNMLWNSNMAARALERLSSGYRINRAGDDAAGLAISEKMRAQIRGLSMAEKNVHNAVSLIQTAEGGLTETHAILQRMRELAVQSANGTYDNDVDRANLNKELQALKDEIDRISSYSNYNGITLLDGGMGGERYKDYLIRHKNDAAAATTAYEGKYGVSLSFSAKLEADYDDLSGSTATIFRNDTGTNGELILQIGDKSYHYDAALDGGSFYEMVDGQKQKVLSVGGSGIENITKGTVVSFKAQKSDGSLTLADQNVKVAVSSSKIVFQVGANSSADNRIGMHADNMSSGNLGIAGGLKLMDISIATQEDARKAIDVIKAATNQVSSTRADFGAMQNRLGHTLNNLGVQKENLQAAESTIRDADMAEEMMNYMKYSILTQVAQAILAQASRLPQGILQLLR